MISGKPIFQLILLSSKNLKNKIQKDEYLNNMTILTSLNKILNITVLNKHKISENLGEFFDFVQCIVDIGNLLQDFVLLCSEESNRNEGWLVHTVLLDCDTHPHLLVCCYVIHRMKVRKFLLHV